MTTTTHQHWQQRENRWTAPATRSDTPTARVDGRRVEVHTPTDPLSPWRTVGYVDIVDRVAAVSAIAIAVAIAAAETRGFEAGFAAARDLYDN